MMETWNWLTSLDRDFAFLLALPFVIGLLALVNEALESKTKSDAE